MLKRAPVYFLILLSLFCSLRFLHAQEHPHLFFDAAGMDALRDRVQTNPRLNKIWLKYKSDRVDLALNATVANGPIPDLDTGRDYGDAVTALTLAYVVTRDSLFSGKAIEIALALADKSSWGEQLSIAHISMGMAFFWDVMFDLLDNSQRSKIKVGVRSNANNQINSNPQSNHNWTPSAAEGLIGLAFKNEDVTIRDFAQSRLNGAKRNFKEDNRSVLWAHGSDGFSPQGLGYWRKYNHMALFFHALRFNEPNNDWYHLGKAFPGSEFLKNTAYPRIYGDVQHRDFACLTWGDSRQVRTKPDGPFGSLGMLTLTASEYKDGYVMDFIDYLIDDAGFRMEDEDIGTFIFYDDAGVPSNSYRDLPLSGYWPNMEGAIFRSGWDKNDIIFYMRCGPPLGHVRRIKTLPADKHSHPDANGFVLFYNNDYLAAEDGGKPQFGLDKKRPITYGHNTILIDGLGQKGDKTPTLPTTQANMDFLDAPHVGFLLGDATDAYEGLDRYYRYVIYKKHNYFIIVDELRDNTSHKYEFLLGTDARHVITSDGQDTFTVRPIAGNAELPVVFVEPQSLNSSINKERPYSLVVSSVDLLRVWPAQNSRKATFMAMLAPRTAGEPGPSYTKIYNAGRSGLLVNGDEVHLYNESGASYSYGDVITDAKLCYFKDDPAQFEYLAAGAKKFTYLGKTGFISDKTLVAAFAGTSGQIRLGKNLGEPGQATITLFHPRIAGVVVDGVEKSVLNRGPGYVTFRLNPKTSAIGPAGFEQTVIGNYTVEILVEAEPESITVNAPNGGESLAGGSVSTIAWTTSGVVDSVKIEVSLDQGSSWVTIIDSAPNTGSFAWAVPDIQAGTALLRISDKNDGTPQDISDGVFSIIKSSITLTAPNGGETWFSGSVQTISWNSVGRIDSVTIEYSLAGGAQWLTIDAKTPNDGSFEWSIPETPTSNGLVRVSDRSDGIPLDSSDGVFAIIQPGLTLIAPNGGETWFSGSVQTISWSSVGAIDSVSLEYSVDGGAQWMLIDPGTPNDGSFEWSIPETPTSNGLVRVSDRSDGIPLDSSDGVFAIIQPGLTLIAPNGGETWFSGSVQTISWSSVGAID
ncbi:MAG: heparinase II/III family protein, partial [bacterium]